MKFRTLVLFVGWTLIPISTFSQVQLPCISMQGNWEWYLSTDQYLLDQDNSGNITGSLLSSFCPGYLAPITGTASPGTFTFTVTGLYGHCGSSIEWLTFQGYIGQPGCNYAYGTWQNSLPNGGNFGNIAAYPPPGTVDIFVKPVDVPSSESTVVPTGAQWDTTYGAPWTQTFAPNSPSGEFEGHSVYEYPGTGSANDTCWFPKSKFPVFNAITTPGFGWSVSSKNTWGVDFIGWSLAAVQYYRSQKRVPCGTTFPQKLVIDAAYSPDNPSTYTGPFTDTGGNIFYGIPYENNTLKANITATIVSSVRNGKTSTNTTWQ